VAQRVHPDELSDRIAASEAVGVQHVLIAVVDREVNDWDEVVEVAGRCEGLACWGAGRPHLDLSWTTVCRRPAAEKPAPAEAGSRVIPRGLMSDDTNGEQRREFMAIQIELFRRQRTPGYLSNTRTDSPFLINN
jgi:hypothetical protein